MEDYRPGYLRFSALVAADDLFNLYRRFSILCTHILLLKQETVSILEKQLKRIDREETAVLFLGSSRCDNNTERGPVLLNIDAALAD